MSKFEIPMNIGPGVILSYKRLSYQAWYAMAEFIDNSTQNFIDNRGKLETPVEVEIVYSKDLIRITDTAMGMSREELVRALSIGVPPPVTTGRSEYGLGLKTAACWFGDEWEVITKKKGETEEFTASVDVEKVASGNTQIPITVAPKDIDQHYTRIEIKKLHRQLQTRTISRMKQHIRSMYRIDLRKGDLKVIINGDVWSTSEADYPLLIASTGLPYKRDFETIIDGKKAHGWVGILNPGSRSNAGIAILRRGRVIKGQPYAWRPTIIFGEARNDLLNQRIVGEIHLDNFVISHTKDEILWQNNEEHELEEYLQGAFADYISAASDIRTRRNQDGPSDTDIALGASQIGNEVSSDDFVDAMNFTDLPPDSVVQQASVPLIESAQSIPPIIDLKIGEVRCKVVLNGNASGNDPYFASEFPMLGELNVFINKNHPHFRRVTGRDGVVNYFKDCIYDALAEYKARQKTTAIKHDTIKYLKDGLLRIEPGEAIED